MSSPQSSRCAALSALLAVLVAAACQQPRRSELPPPPGPRERPASTASRTISLRLTTYEGARELWVGGTETGALSFVAEGGVIRCSNGATRRSFTLRPRAAGLSLGGERYPGRLSLTTHPEGGLRATLMLDLEDYVRGVVAGELPLLRAAQSELEAQAVAARSYALARWRERSRAGRAPFLWDDTRDQVYRPLPAVQSPPLREAHARLDAAIVATRGEVLIYRGELFDARYHAACGGATAPLASVPGSAGVTCGSCSQKTARELEWSFTATSEELSQVARALGIGERLVIVEPARALSSERWGLVNLIGTAGSKTVSVGRLRALLGAERFASNLIVRTWPHPGKPIAAGLRIDGRGRGHGSGMCQEGAHELASRGWSKTRILAHYYPGTSTQSWTSGNIP
ncbi:MAG: SpoIID/LytB domain-containing protein [Planctomycetes bacterium]|nr:SpoIID/LytB domain-containing protein [Planctomycetota bacterium]